VANYLQAYKLRLVTATLAPLLL